MTEISSRNSRAHKAGIRDVRSLKVHAKKVGTVEYCVARLKVGEISALKVSTFEAQSIYRHTLSCNKLQCSRCAWGAGNLQS